MSVNHLPEHPHAFLDSNSIVEAIAVFDENAHGQDLINQIAIDQGHATVICCCTFGLPVIGDTWDQTNKTWIETAKRFSTPAEVEADLARRRSIA